MATLLVQGCSKSKNRPQAAVPALELYSGYFFKIIKKAIREGEFSPRIDLCILSAEYGLVDADTPIEWYDRRMDTDRAIELAPAVRSDLEAQVEDRYDRVIANVGRTYRRALDEAEAAIDADLYYIEGSGIGVKGNVLKRVVRGELDAATTSPTSVAERA